ncbi:diguanylate cyclase [Aeromicrobium sp. CFBP 8757]|uniref:GGDEF domain-containing protein n=1 Tax=Aeromicrobium sp. CFBP 8757 TaxID=2775288 RepID=UPI00177C10B1|nr:diguanylate cyclase [Aeromicrobium sp. CFBP 8757]
MKTGPTRVIPPFAWVTSAGGLVIALSGLVDALTSTGDVFGSAWTWGWVAITVVLATVPLAFGDRLVREIGVVGSSVFFAVTSLQMALSTSAVASVNNLVLYPMVACYLGWFYPRAVSRVVTAAAFAMSGAALAVNTHDRVFITWVNLVLASTFCLEAAGYLRARLDREITTDPLTGVLNRSGLDDRIDVELGRAARSGAPLTVGIIDLDGFKQVNDEHGHAAGDRLLVAFAAALRDQTRPYDTVARIGGDEFLVMMPDTAASQAGDFFERLRAATRDPWSYGLAEAVLVDSARTIRARADLELYAQKVSRRRARDARADPPVP